MPFICIGSDPLILNTDHIIDVSIEKGLTRNVLKFKGQTRIRLTENKCWWFEGITPMDIWTLIREAEKTEKERETTRLEELFEEKGF